MSNLVVIGYDDQFKAEEVGLMLWKIQKEHLIDLQDSAVAVKDGWGKVKLLHKPFNPTTDDAAGGGFWATILGAILLIFYGSLPLLRNCITRVPQVNGEVAGQCSKSV